MSLLLESNLILLRHGQSVWNSEPSRFTGWCDVPLTVKGRVEAVSVGQLLRSRGFRAANVDVAFTSELQRAHETCELALASMAGHEQDTWSSERIRRDVRLNERHYGAVQGLYKDDPALRAAHGEERIRHWRRSMDGRPPALNEAHPEWRPRPAPTTESLADCQRRVVECFEERIAPALFDCGDPATGGWTPQSTDRTVVVVAHSNTLRSLMAYFDEVGAEEVPHLHVPNSVPIQYRFERHSQKILSTKLQSAAGGSHARWLLSPENHASIRKAILPGGLLTRAVIDSWDLDRTGVLSVGEIETGIKAMLSPHVERGQSASCAVIAVAKKIVRELPADASMTVDDLERMAAAEVADISSAVVRQNAADLMGRGPIYGEEMDDFSAAPPLSY